MPAQASALKRRRTRAPSPEPPARPALSHTTHAEKEDPVLKDGGEEGKLQAKRLMAPTVEVEQIMETPPGPSTHRPCSIVTV